MEQSDDSSTEKSGNEVDETQRSFKKFKRQLSVKNEAMNEVAPPRETGETPNNAPISFLQVIPSSQTIYTGEGEDESDLDSFCDFYHSNDVSSTSLAGSRPRLVVPDNRCRQLWKPWRRALFITVLGRRNLSFEMMQQSISDVWSFLKGHELVEFDGVYIIRFYSKADYNRVLENAPWMIHGDYITITKWTPYFVPSAVGVSATQIWVRVLNPPIEFFCEDILLQIGNLLGQAIKIDDKFPTKRNYARICVKVDLTKPLIPSIEVNELELDIGYEGLHEICFRCGKYGHKLEKCTIPAHLLDHGCCFGPWMVA